jgi:anti-sigma B factor antagonist
MDVSGNRRTGNWLAAAGRSDPGGTVRRFTMAIEPQAGGVRVVLSGELDSTCAYTFDAQMRTVEERRPDFIVLDLRGLDFVDSAGIGRILAAHRRARQAGRAFRLTRGTKTVQRVLAITALDQVREFEPEPVAAG